MADDTSGKELIVLRPAKKECGCGCGCSGQQ